MTAPLSRVVDRFAGLHVVVLGDVMLDSYVEGTASRLCREGPVPVVRVEERRQLPGGAGNAAVNLAALGARVSLVALVGDDAEGALLRESLGRRGVGTDRLVVDEGRATLALHRVVAGSQLLVRFDEGSTEAAGPAAERRLAARLADVVPAADAVVVSDYGNGVMTTAVLDALAGLQARRPGLLVVDSKHPSAFRRLRPTAVKPNWSEALQLLGTGKLDGVSERADGIADDGDAILELTGAQIAAVTLDAEGAIVFERGRPPHRTYASRRREGRKASGAGDTFVSAFTLALAAGAHTPAAAELASAAAAVVVGKDHTAVCSAEELRASVVTEEKYLRALDRVAARVGMHRREGRRVVFTNGCFDILHRGHITYLNRAKTLGDVLVVGVNDDAGVRRLKGPSRPINPLEDRVEVLAALSCVDQIVAFAGDSPSDLIRAIRPDVYVKGGDYTHETLPEVPIVEEVGGEVRILPLMEDRSTTGIIERIRSSPVAAEPAESR